MIMHPSLYRQPVVVQNLPVQKICRHCYIDFVTTSRTTYYCDVCRPVMKLKKRKLYESRRVK